MKTREIAWRDVPDGATIIERGHAPERVGSWGPRSDVISNGQYRIIDGQMHLINPDAIVEMIIEEKR